MPPTSKKYPTFNACIRTVLEGQTFHLHPHAAIYWEERKTLLVADLHLGKATHFRRHGLAVPTYVQDETLEKLTGLLLDFKPERLLMLGDLFHSDYNPEWEDFADLVMAFSHVKFALVPGNHDRLTYHQYEKYNIEVHEEPYFEGPFAFSHHPLEEEVIREAELEQGRPTGERVSYNLAGHVHPAVMLQGKRERMRLPCYYFGEQAGLFPAFGAFTGTYTIQPTKGDEVFVLTGDKAIRVG